MGAPVAIPTSAGINTLLMWGQEQTKTWQRGVKGGWILGKGPLQAGLFH